jgi:prepilin-type N-terminal cleavage/methylation domain-containing protein
MGGTRARAGFSLVELMVAVAIIGILAATAIPVFAGMVNRSKTGEVSSNLASMFKLSAAYYASERSTGQGFGTNHSGFCILDDAGPVPVQALPTKQAFTADASFRSLGFTLADFTYFSYGIVSKNAASSCGNLPNTPDLYTFYAHGDLDGDGVESTFELAAGSDGSNVLMHSRAVAAAHETE